MFLCNFNTSLKILPQPLSKCKMNSEKLFTVELYVKIAKIQRCREKVLRIENNSVVHTAN